MADTDALRDAERLLHQADALLNAIDAEIAAMKAIFATAEEGIARAEATARATGDQVRRLSKELEAGRVLQGELVTALAELAGGGRRLEARIARALSEPVTAVAAGSGGLPPALPVATALPVFRRTTRAEIEAVALRPAQAHEAAWERIAESHPSLAEELEAALKLLDEAEALAESGLAGRAELEAERKRRARRASAARPQGVDPP